MLTEAVTSSHVNDVHLFREARAGNVAARNQLVERHFRIVRGAAGTLLAKLPPTVELGDLLTAGGEGLMDAVVKFEPERGFRFGTYAGRRVLGAMLDFIRDYDPVPRHVRRREKLVKTAKAELLAANGREPTPAEIAASLGLDAEQFAPIAADADVVEVHSLSGTVYQSDKGKAVSLVNTLVDESAADPSFDRRHESLRDVLLSNFTLSQALVVRMRYIDGETFEQIGKSMKLGASRLAQIHGQVLRTLRARFSFEQLADLIGEAA